MDEAVRKVEVHGAVERDRQGEEDHAECVLWCGKGLLVLDVVELARGVAVHEQRFPEPELDRAEHAVPDVVEHAAGARHVLLVELALAVAQRVQRERPEAEVREHDERVDGAAINDPVRRPGLGLLEVVRADEVVGQRDQEPHEVGRVDEEVERIDPAVRTAEA